MKTSVKADISLTLATALWGLSDIFVPVILWVLFKQKFEKSVLMYLGIALAGIIIFFWNGKIQFNLGDILRLLSVIFYAAYIIAIEKTPEDVNGYLLEIFQFVFVGTYASVFSLIFESPMLLNTLISCIAIIGLGIFCTIVPFIIQITAQKRTTSVHAGMIFTLQPIFTAVFVFIFIGEVFSVKKLLEVD